ncbi:MAG: Maf family protein [Pseudomonadota bacterium]
MLYLASQSPRRAQLLDQLGVAYQVVTAPIDESVAADEKPGGYVERMAREKALAGWDHVAKPPAMVLGADTSVVVDEEILGKPANRRHALSLLAQLSGRTHQVMTGVALYDGALMRNVVSVTDVTFRAISREMAEAYWDTGEPADKAGGYAIQGRGAIFVTKIVGSYSGVVGLPLFEVAELFAATGVEVMRAGERFEVATYPPTSGNSR